MRAAIARRMVQSKQQAPHFYVSTDIEMERLLAVVAERNDAVPPERRISLTAYLVRAVALTLVDHPAFNAVWDGDQLYRVDQVNVGVAIALDDGLIAPALLDAASRSVDDLAGALSDLVARTRTGRLRGPEITDATFTLSNLGMFGVTSFAAIVTPPQVAILATGRTEPRAVVRDGEVVARRMMTATLSSDHRVVDGAGAARFLETLKARLETPQEWLAHEPVSATA